MSHRSYVKRNISIYGESNGKLFERTFRIVKVISEGADGICYEAFHKTSGKGVLKEFYPDKYVYLLERNGRGQLGISADFPAATEDFISVRNRFLAPYRMLLDIKQSSDDRDISSFIPQFEIYQGCDASQSPAFEGTVYIWTPEPELVTFDMICKEIHRHPHVRPEYNLVTVLSAVQTLAKCVCALHSAGIIHRDIKPSNFGFTKRRGETLTQTLTMFDIDSLCSIWDESPDTIVTVGYTEPEAGYKECSNQTDIYSIGATLFTAVVITDETRASGYLYREDYYEYLKRMIAESELMIASEANSHPRLRNLLVSILKKCLCERKQRYQNCEALIADLNEALFYALPPEVAKKSRRGEKWILSEVERSLDAGTEKNSSLSILYSLYEHPLYRHIRKDEEKLNVLIIGFRNYGQKFLDACLQIGQMRGTELNVTVVTDDDTDREIYLSERPALADFFNIDLRGTEDPYGNISFINTEEGSQENTGISLSDTIAEITADKHIHYVFIAMGDDVSNHRTAVLCRKLFKKKKDGCSISYVSNREERKRKADTYDLIPVCISNKIRRSQKINDLERMAFNTHLIWEKNLDLDFKTIKREFRKPYNHDSSISSVIALKYKLITLGIDLDSVPADEAARRYSALISEDNEKAEKIRDELIWIEHRRWVSEKICKGWTCQKDLESLISGPARDEKSRKHICLLHSRPDQLLKKLFMNTDRTWDQITEQEFDALDDLDKLSVRMHRIYAGKASAVRSSKLLRNTLLSGIKSTIEGKPESLWAFNEWYSCINNIWNGDSTKLLLYRSRKDQFAETAKLFSPETQKAVIQQIRAFDRFFHPVLASMEYKDWKQLDTAFIDNIPFVLTYTEKINLIIPYNADTAADQLFSNVSSATIIRPDRIIYLYQADEDGNVQNLLNTLPLVLTYMDNRRINASVEFIIGSSAAHDGEETESVIRNLSNGRIRNTAIISGLLPAAEELYSYLPQGRSVTAAERNKTELSDQLEAAGFYDRFAEFSFDPAEKSFDTSAGCDLFGYIRKDTFITTRDLALFDAAVSVRSEKPEFFEDYEMLWDKYAEDPETWQQLCRLLGGHSETHDCIARFCKTDRKKSETYQYVIPAFCWFGASEAVKQLKDGKILSDGGVSAGYSTDSCIVKLTDPYGLKKEYDELFRNVYALADPSALSVKVTGSDSAGIWFDDLIVSGMQIGEDAGKGMIGLLGYLEEKGYLIALKYDHDRVSFTYASRQIKQLLTSPARIVELYVYHSARNMGVYDDVSLGTLHTCSEKGGDLPCCLMTRGFTSTIMLFDEVEELPQSDTGYGINTTVISAKDFLNS